MTKDDRNRPFRPGERAVLKRKIHRALVEARKALHRGDEAAAREITRRVMAEAAPEAYRASLSGGHNWVVEALKPLDELLLPEDE